MEAHQERLFFGILFGFLLLLFQILVWAVAVGSFLFSGRCHLVLCAVYHCVKENVNLSSDPLPCLAWRDSLQT